VVVEIAVGETLDAVYGSENPKWLVEQLELSKSA
jgi:hypothetical protein